MQFTDSATFMASSLSNRVNNLSEDKSTFGDDDKKCETYRIKYKYCDSFLKYTDFKNDLGYNGK